MSSLSYWCRAFLFVALVACSQTAEAANVSSCSPAHQGELVRLDVVATDGDGHPALNLHAEDFRVIDEGKPQQIVFLRPSENEWKSPQQLANFEYSNRVQRSIPHVTVILFDELNADIQIGTPAWVEMVRALRRFESQEDLYLYLLTEEGVLYPVHGVPKTGWPAAASSRNWIEETLPHFEAMRRRIYGFRPEHQLAGVEATWYALTNLVSLLRDLPGRKNLIWIGSGAPFSVRQAIEHRGRAVQSQLLEAQMTRFLSGLSAAQVAVYEVGGTGPAISAASQASGSMSLVSDDEALKELPEFTGGRAWSDGDIAQALARAIADQRTAYRLAYYRSQQNSGRKDHKINVICTRPGIKVSAQKRYEREALPNLREDRASDADRGLAVAVASPFESAAIGLRARIEPEQRQTGKMALHVEIHVPDLLLFPQGEHRCGELLMEIAGYTDNGRKEMVGAPSEIPVSVTQRQAEIQSSIGVDRTVTVGREVKNIRVVVLDRHSFEVGSLDIPVGEVPAPTVP